MVETYSLATLALRNVSRQRGRSSFVIAAVAVAVIALILAGGFIKDTIVELGESIIYGQAGHMQLSRSGYRAASSFDPEAFILENAEELRNSLHENPLVKQVLLRLYTAGLASNGDAEWPVVIEGVEPSGESAMGSYINIKTGRQLSDVDEFGVLLGAGVAKALKLEPGDFMDVLVTTVDGSMNSLEFEVVGTFQTFSKDYDAIAVRLSLSAVQELLGVAGANVAVVELLDTSYTDTVVQTFREVYEPAGLVVDSWVTLDPFYKQTVILYQQQFGFLVVVILLLVILCVATAMSSSIHERTAEFGTMRALGTRDERIRSLVLIESATLGFAGAIVGVVAGNLMAIAISAKGIPMPPPPNSDLGYVSLIRLSIPVTLLAFALGATAPVFAARQAVRRCLNQPIIDALQRAV